MRLRRQPARRVREDDVDALRARRLDRVEDDRRRIALVLRHHRHVVARRPFGELLARRGAKRVARGEEHRAALRLEEMGELRDGRRLARAVHAREQDHEGVRERLRQRLLERTQELHECRLQLPFQRGAVLDALLALRPAQALHECRRRRDADIGRDELRFQLLEQRLVDLRAGAQDRERARPARARELEILLEERFERHGRESE